MKRIRFFQQNILLANISLKMALKISFFTFNKANIWFIKKKFVYKTYMTAKALLTTRQVKIIKKIKFLLAILETNNQIFIMHIADLAEFKIMPILAFQEAQVVSLTNTKIFAKYSNFFNIFFSDSTVELPEYTKINNHLIN